MNSERRQSLFKTWYESAMRCYFPAAEASFYNQVGFKNPVAQIFHQAMQAIVDGVLADSDPLELRVHIEKMMRVVAVQGLPAGYSIRFITLLRRLLESEPDLPAAAKAPLIEKTDALAEIAVEIWCERRETLSQLQINELRKRLQRFESVPTPRNRGGTD